jgi:hypothetical protein
MVKLKSCKSQEEIQPPNLEAPQLRLGLTIRGPVTVGWAIYNGFNMTMKKTQKCLLN